MILRTRAAGWRRSVGLAAWVMAHGLVRSPAPLFCAGGEREESAAVDSLALVVVEMKTEIVGGCLCGGTRYRLEEAPRNLCDCHCEDCRRSSGAPFVTWGTVARERLRVTSGGVRQVPHAGRVRSFAACCGTHLFFEDSADAPTIDVTIATLDDPRAFAPGRIIWVEDRLPWVKLDERLPAFRRSSEA